MPDTDILKVKTLSNKKIKWCEISPRECDKKCLRTNQCSNQ